MKKRTNKTQTQQTSKKNAREARSLRQEELAGVNGGGYVPFDSETMVIE